MSHNLPTDIIDLSKDLVAAALAKKKTIGTAESCTGGLIGAAITAIPGCSDVFYGGIISYDNTVKVSQLSVDPTPLYDENIGAVSEEVAMQMAKGCRERLGVDIAVSVTGIAGPGGARPGKPVGTVWIGLATEKSVTAKLHNFSNMDRNEVRKHTCLAALQTLLNILS